MEWQKGLDDAQVTYWLFDLRYTLRSIHYVGKCMLHSCEPTAFICRWPCSKFKRNCVPIPGIPVGFNLFTSQIIAVFKRSSVLDRTEFWLFKSGWIPFRIHQFLPVALPVSSSWILSWLGELPIFGSPLCCCLAPPARQTTGHVSVAPGLGAVPDVGPAAAAAQQRGGGEKGAAGGARGLAEGRKGWKGWTWPWMR